MKGAKGCRSMLVCEKKDAKGNKKHIVKSLYAFNKDHIKEIQTKEATAPPFPLLETGIEMYFYIDLKSQTVKAFFKCGVAPKYALGLFGVPLTAGEDPVKKARGVIEGRGLIVSLSGAFESIAESGDTAAQELAADFAKAVNELYDGK